MLVLLILSFTYKNVKPTTSISNLDDHFIMVSFLPRMSAENYRLMREIAVKLFKERKVEISDAIKTTFPLLEILRDRGLITNEKYKVSEVYYVTIW